MTLGERNEEMRSLYEDGWTFQDLADEFGLSRGHIWHIFVANGWSRRRPGPPKGTPLTWLNGDRAR